MKKPKEKDFIPESDAEFDKWARNFVEKLPAIAHKVGITQEEVDEVKAAVEKSHASYLSRLDAAYDYALATEKLANIEFKQGMKEACRNNCAEILLIDGDERLEPFYRRAHEMLKKLEE